MTLRFARFFFVPLTAAMLTACSATGGEGTGMQPQVRQVTQSAHCGLTGPGVAHVRSEGELEALLDVSGQNMATGVIRQVNLDRESLVIVTLGQKPTAGYSVGRESATADRKTLKLAMKVNSPAPDMMVAQVITSPCAVLAVADSQWQRLEVSGLSETPLLKELGN